MPSDWVGTPYVRVYLTLARDHPRVWSDPALLGAYVRMLALADPAYPAPVEVPRAVSEDQVHALVSTGVLEPLGDNLYAFHGLDHERTGRVSRGRAGGLARARAASRGDAGRFAGQSNGNAGPSLVPVAGGVAGRSPATAGDAGHQRTSDTAPAAPADSGHATTSRVSTVEAPPAGDPDPIGAGSGSPEVGARFLGITDADCADVEGHGASHRYVIGVGWRCLICDAPEVGEESFRDKARRHGASHA